MTCKRLLVLLVTRLIRCARISLGCRWWLSPLRGWLLAVTEGYRRLWRVEILRIALRRRLTVLSTIITVLLGCWTGRVSTILILRGLRAILAIWLRRTVRVSYCRMSMAILCCSRHWLTVRSLLAIWRMLSIRRLLDISWVARS